MAGDLERFLQQAAERLKQKLDDAAPHAAPPPRQPPVRQAERARPNLQADYTDSEIVQAELVDAGSHRNAGPNPLSNIDTRPALAQHIGRSDERMAGHLHNVFDHQVLGLQQASSALQSGGNETNRRSEVTVRKHQISPLVEMLRRADTLQSAFIASEVFARKF